MEVIIDYSKKRASVKGTGNKVQEITFGGERNRIVDILCKKVEKVCIVNLLCGIFQESHKDSASLCDISTAK